MKKLSFFIATLCMVAFFAPLAHAQDMEKVKENLVAAQRAFDSGDYRTTLSRVQAIETETRGVIFPATSYLKVMSYYRLGQYQNCLDAANAYLSSNRVLRDETLTQINAAVSDSRSKLAAEQKAAQQAAAAQAAAAEQKRLHDAEAAKEWQRISATSDMTVLRNFIAKYKGTPSEKSAQTLLNELIAEAEAFAAAEQQRRYEAEVEAAWRRVSLSFDLADVQNFLNKYGNTSYRDAALKRKALLEYKQYEKQLIGINQEISFYRNVFLIPSLVIDAAGIGFLCYGIAEQKQTFTWIGVGALGVGAMWAIYPYFLWEIPDNKAKRNDILKKMNTLRPQISLSPGVMPIYPHGNPFDGGNLAYGVKVSVRF